MNNIVFVSGWIRGKEPGGIGMYEMSETGTLTLKGMYDTDISFNAMHIDREKSLLYALNETDKLPGVRAGGGGQVYVYKIDRENLALSLLAKTPTWCPNPSYISLDPTGKFAVVSNHSSKSVATKIRQNADGKYELEIITDDAVVELFEIKEDGTLGELLDVVKHYGSGPEARQASPRPHCAVASPDGKFFAVCDKGNDTVRLYQINPKRKKLFIEADPFRCESGSLPRYCVFHPEKKYFYNNNENNYFLSAYSYDEAGMLTRISQDSVVPEGFTCDKPKQEQQGLSIHPCGRYIYDIVRGPNTVSVMEVNEESGSTHLVQQVLIEDEWPRGCTLTEDGRFLIVCGLLGGKIFVLTLDDEGLIQGSAKVYEQPCAAYAVTWQND